MKKFEKLKMILYGWKAKLVQFYTYLMEFGVLDGVELVIL